MSHMDCLRNLFLDQLAEMPECASWVISNRIQHEVRKRMESTVSVMPHIDIEIIDIIWPDTK